MESRAHAIVALIFLAVLSLIAVGFFFWLTPGAPATRPYVVITDQSAGGLHPEAPVRFKGLKAGQVDAVGFAPNDPNKVRIAFSVKKGIPVTKSTYAQLGTQGITGLKSLNLSNPDPDAASLDTSADHPAGIPLHPGLLDKLEDAGTQNLARISTILDRAEKLLSEDNRRHIDDTIAQLDTATKQLVAAERAAQPALEQLPQITQRARATIGTLDTLADAARTPVKRAADLEDSIQSLSESTQAMVRTLNYETLPRINSLTETMQRTTEHVDQLSQELAAKPQSVILGAPEAPPGPGEPGFRR